MLRPSEPSRSSVSAPMRGMSRFGRWDSATISQDAQSSVFFNRSRLVVGRGDTMAQGLAIAATCSCIVAGCLFVADGQAQAQTTTQTSPAQVRPIEAAALSPMQEEALEAKDTF